MPRCSFLILVLALGCGDDDTIPSDSSTLDARDSAADTNEGGLPVFTCDALSDADQCWNRATRLLHDCIPSGAGVLNAARTECTWTDGTTARFNSAVPTNGNFEPNFTILDPAGSECGSFASGGFTVGIITVGESSASLLQEPGPRAKLACDDDGVETVAFDVAYSDFSDCAASDEPLVPPGYNALIGETFVRIQIIADGKNDSPQLIDCTQS